MGYLNLSGLSRFYTGLKGKFLLQSNVANVLTTTAAGKALDARQGKALKGLIDGGNPTYTHTKNGTVHNFAGAGKLGYAILTADYASGDTFTVNGTPVTVYGDMSMLADDAGVVLTVSGGVLYFYAAASPFTIPDGDTVATLNDADIWLSCAGVNPATAGNPTLSAILSSQSYCETLMNSANAVNYMLRSPTILGKIPDSTTAIAALNASNPFVSQYMTSSNTPTGYAAVGESSSAVPWQALSEEYGYQNTSTWLKIQLPEPIWPFQVVCKTKTNNGSAGYGTTLYIDGSADNSMWTQIGDCVVGNTAFSNLNTIVLSATQQYQYYRFRRVGGGTDWCVNFTKFSGKTREV